MSSVNYPPNKQRLAIAVQAARLLAEDGRLDYLSAKQKATKLCHVNGQADLPTNQEIEAQLVIYQDLFDQDDRRILLRDMRKDALEMMRQLELFEPLLVGAVLAGTAVANSPIELHIFSDSVKDVVILLIEKNISYEAFDRKVRLNKNESLDVPMISFCLGAREVELSVFEYKMRKQKPMSSISQLPMKRANIKKLEGLMQ